VAAAIERAFAINADPETIWGALWHDLSEGDAEFFDVEASSWPRTLSLLVDLSGMPYRLTYSIEPQLEHTEVAILAEALSWRYGLFQVATFGHYRRNIELTLTIALSNLKTALEGEPIVDDEEALGDGTEDGETR
jgi:hypothetical protein